MTDPLKQFIGTLYFSPTKDKNDRPISKYEGVVSAFIVRRDDGSEFEVRSESPLPYSSQPLKRKDLDTLEVGSEVQSIRDNTRYTVLRVFPTYGDVWVKSKVDGSTHALKYIDLKRAL